jgi:DNA-binding HxlR family transcriptional regulator
MDTLNSKYLYTIHERTYVCPLHLALSTVMGKWKGLIIWFLHDKKVARYGELKREINTIVRVTDKMLIQSLKELESDGLIERKVYPVVPPKLNIV